MTRVTAPSRLHFGLFHVPTPGTAHAYDSADDGTKVPARSFGGVGLMIDQPGTAVTVRPAPSWQFEGTLASRAQRFARRFVLGLPEADQRAFQVLIERSPPEHSGLGVGTQLGLTIAKGLAVEIGFAGLTAVDLAIRVGRGERSAVGIHGFDRGGMLFEAGKLPEEAVSPLVARCDFPEAWRVVLILPPTRPSWSGERERQAFENVRSGDASHRLTERLTRLAFLAMLPAAQSADWQTFGESVYEFNRLAGEPFVRAQGGPYATKEAEELIQTLRQMGVKGVGQSSWGPALFAIAEDEGEARVLATAVRGRRADFQTVVARASASGASVEHISDG